MSGKWYNSELFGKLVTQQCFPFREFIQSHYVKLKQDNPQLPILIRECSGVQPRLWTRFGELTGARWPGNQLKLIFLVEMGKESSVSLTNLKAQDILKQIESAGPK